MKRSSLDTVRESLRLQQVYNVFLRYGWDIGLQRWPAVNSLRHQMQSWIWQLPDRVDLDSVSLPTKVRMMLEELGPTYVKMGQIVSSQASVIPQEWSVELVKLQSNVPAFPANEVREVIKEELGAYPEMLYATFEPQPFAAASTAQVHKATLADGTRVAVKVQRPRIRTQMRADVGLMQNAASVLARRSEAVRAIDLPGMLEQFGTNVIAELDYNNEAYNAHILSQNLATLPGVSVPKVYHELSTSKILTLEFIRGVKISNLEAIDQAGLDRQALAKNALRAVVKMLLIDGFFHADPHPGNVLVNLETGNITLIDTGMVGELDLSNRLNLIQLIMAAQKNDIPAMGRVLRSLSIPFMGEVDDAAFYHDFQRKMGSYVLTNHADVGMAVIVNQALELLREHGLRLDSNLTMALKAMMQAEAIATLLYPQGGLLEDGTQMVRELALEQITADKILDVAKQQASVVVSQALAELPSLQTATLNWLKQYRKGRFEVYVDTSSLGTEVERLGRIGRLAVISIILAGMLISSAIATILLTQTQQQGDTWYFIGRLAYLGYIFSMTIAAIMVVKLIWDWIHGRDVT